MTSDLLSRNPQFADDYNAMLQKVLRGKIAARPGRETLAEAIEQSRAADAHEVAERTQ